MGTTFNEFLMCFVCFELIGARVIIFTSVIFRQELHTQSFSCRVVEYEIRERQLKTKTNKIKKCLQSKDMKDYEERKLESWNR